MERVVAENPISVLPKDEPGTRRSSLSGTIVVGSSP
jgi:hypothetical protein